MPKGIAPACYLRNTMGTCYEGFDTIESNALQPPPAIAQCARFRATTNSVFAPVSLGPHSPMDSARRQIHVPPKCTDYSVLFTHRPICPRLGATLGLSWLLILNLGSQGIISMNLWRGDVYERGFRASTAGISAFLSSLIMRMWRHGKAAINCH